MESSDECLDHFFEIGSQSHTMNCHSKYFYETFSSSSEETEDANGGETGSMKDTHKVPSYEDIISIMCSSKNKGSNTVDSYLNSFEEIFNLKFPRIRISNIEDAIHIWTIDYQVEGKIYPRMCNWEMMNRIPHSKDFPVASKRYEFFKSLYESWAIDCHKSFKEWHRRYGRYDLEQISKVRRKIAAKKQKKRLRLKSSKEF